MDFRTKTAESIKKFETQTSGSSFFRKLKIFAWETGLGPVINLRPDVLGQQAVLYFPGRSGKFSLPCHEQDGKILLALTEKELENIREILIQNPTAEMWLKNGWYAGNVRLLNSEEKAAVEEKVSDEQFFGYVFRSFIKPSLKDHYLLEAARTAPCTGTDGPGSKAWIWPLAIVGILLFRKRK